MTSRPRQDLTDSRTDRPHRERVLEALRAVEDPQTDTDIVASGLVAEVEMAEGRVTVRAGLSELEESTRPSVVTATERAVAAVPGVEAVDIEAASDGGNGAVATATERFDRVVAVASAKGGVGKSTVSTMLACALAATEEVALFDADVHGPNVPTLLGAEGPVRADDDGSPTPVTVEGEDATLELMSVGLLESGTPLAWRGAMAHEAVAELFAETAWAHDDTLVIDLPPGTGDVVLTTLQEVPVDGVVVVTTPFHASVDDTRRTVELFRDEGVPVLGAIINMDGMTCPSCGDTHDLFPGSAGDDLPASTLARIPFTTDLQGRATPGEAPDTIQTLADDVRSAVATAWTVEMPPGAVDLRGAPPTERHERVREAFAGCAAGEPFRVVSDRDPSPVVGFLADLAGEPRSAFDVEVTRPTPNAWLLTTTRP